MNYLLILVFLFAIMLVYFRIAKKYHIVDRPNERSSHEKATIRGGGIIFIVAVLLSGFLYTFYWGAIVGATLLAIISFLDDTTDVSRRLRVFIHLLAVSLLFYVLPVFGILPWWAIIGLYILVIGIINAYNFMDGINGMTGLYSLVVFGGIQYVNIHQVSIVEPDMIWIPMLACVVFLFYNFRKRALCFAGDVGSVVIAFMIISFLLGLIFKTGDWTYILFLAVYGVDTVLTLIHRLILKENIFEAHRLHFYQILANEQKIPHLVVSAIYAIIQILIISIVLFWKAPFVMVFFATTLPLVILYVFLKPRLMKG